MSEVALTGGSTAMSNPAEIGHDADLLSAFEAAHAALDELETGVDDGLYQEIADRRAQTEDADILRRARAL
jgi:hypothetical protein